MTLAALFPLALIFVNPLPFPDGLRLWMMLPLVACVATVYRATRVRTVSEIPRATIINFLNITVGMILIAAAFYALHAIVRHCF